MSPPRLWTFVAPDFSPEEPMIVSPSPYSCVPPARPSAMTIALRGVLVVAPSARLTALEIAPKLSA